MQAARAGTEWQTRLARGANYLLLSHVRSDDDRLQAFREALEASAPTVVTEEELEACKQQQ